MLPDAIPIMVLSGAVQFPQSLMPLFIFEQRYRDMLSFALESERLFGVAYAAPGIDPETSPDPVRPVFTAGLIRACVTHTDGTSHLMLAGLRRVEVIGWEQVFPFRIAAILPVPDLSVDASGERRLSEELISCCLAAIGGTGKKEEAMRSQLPAILEQLDDPAEIADLVAHNFVDDPRQRQELLEIIPVKERLEYLFELLT